MISVEEARANVFAKRNAKEISMRSALLDILDYINNQIIDASKFGESECTVVIPVQLVSQDDLLYELNCFGYYAEILREAVSDAAAIRHDFNSYAFSDYLESDGRKDIPICTIRCWSIRISWNESIIEPKKEKSLWKKIVDWF